MNLEKLNPWNWFKHEDSSTDRENTIPVRREEYGKLSSSQNSLNQLHYEIDRLFNDAFKNFGFPSLSRDWFTDFNTRFNQLPSFSPDLNISSDDKEYMITLEAAGLGEQDLDINLTDRRLTIKGNKQEETENKDKDFYRIERRYGSFQRVLALPDDADSEKITASMKNGLLTIRVPRNEKLIDSQSKSIKIEKS